ncbi:hypothetical protein KIN20_020137 [Parelaphostrongylus tenuis]|uniref:Uncharacterized protein n=1 Tax=Parelaphostrongylus tenuis TaxID=148309 RepID=A0AAD5MM11_PARTN|nr:hypothetical protein KIN20_020137 [Parelaphostrongylus tenuis]
MAKCRPPIFTPMLSHFDVRMIFYMVTASNIANTMQRQPYQTPLLAISFNCFGMLSEATPMIVPD